MTILSLEPSCKLPNNKRKMEKSPNFTRNTDDSDPLFCKVGDR